jgi:uncharacterized RmlC-like cupin family protein
LLEVGDDAIDGIAQAHARKREGEREEERRERQQGLFFLVPFSKPHTNYSQRTKITQKLNSAVCC